MESKILSQAKSQVKIQIQVLAQDLRRYFSQVFERFAPEVEIKGFRPGKAPQRMVIEKVGTSRINQEVLDMAIRDNLGQAIKTHQLRPITSPQVKVSRWTFNPLAVSDSDILEFEVELGLRPEVKLKDYSKIRVKLAEQEQKLQVAKEEVAGVIKRLQQQSAKMEPIDRPAESGDWLEIGFSGSVKGVVQEKLVSQRHPLILGSKSLLPGFEEKLIGLKLGQTTEFSLELPQDFRDKNLAGQKVDFKVIVNSLRKVELPPLDNAFAAKFGQPNMDKLSEAIEQDILKQKQLQAKKALEQKVLEKALRLLETEVPKSLIEQETGSQLARMKQNLGQQGMSFEKYLQVLGKSEQDLTKDLSAQSKKNIQIGLLLSEVIKREGWDPTDKTAAQRAVDKLVQIATS